MSIAEKLIIIAENEQVVADLNNQLGERLNGNSVSENEVLSKVYEAGKKAEYDRFWDSCQQKGARTDYRYAFGYASWHSTNFYPKYNINPKGDASSMFGGICWGSWTPFSLKKRLEDCGVTLDTSQVTNATQMFNSCKFTELPIIDISNVTITAGMFSYCDVLTSIEKLIVSEKTGALSSGIFVGCSKLTHIRFEGTIAKSLHLSNTNLDHDSIMSAINCLKDISGTGTTLTLTLGTTLLAKLTDTEKAIATQKGWTLA